VDDELREYLERLRQENLKAHLETWSKIAALERRLDAMCADNAAAHAETRLHTDAAVERLERQFELFAIGPSQPVANTPAEVHFRRDG